MPQSPTVRVVQKTLPITAQRATTGVHAHRGPNNPGGGNTSAQQSAAKKPEGRTEQPTRPQPESVVQQLADDEAAQLAIENQAEEEDEKRTLPEDVGPKKLQQNLLNLERKRERKESQVAREEQAIADQRGEISRQQAVLVELQAAADATMQEIRDIDDTRAEMSKRLDQLNAERVRGTATECDVVDDPPPECNLSALVQGGRNLLQADSERAAVDGAFIRQLLN